MIYEREFKGCKAIQLESEKIRVVLLPSIGGKIASIYRKDKDFELLFQNRESFYGKANLYDDFGQYDASGFDDAFPTIDSCTVSFDGKEVQYPNHGEIWTASFAYSILEEKVHLSYKSRILDYSYEKVAYIDGESLIIEYEIENQGNTPIPCIWAMHCLMRCEEDMRFIFPAGAKEVINVYESKHLGEVGRVHPYPITKDMFGNSYHLDRVFSINAGKAEKYYLKGKVEEGYCGIVYPSQNVCCHIYFDKEKLSYLGLWITEGGFRGDYNCALEPTNGYYDSIDTARREKKLFELKPKEKLSFTIRIELE